MIRLKDVAARARVSLMTVSKVLRDAPDVSQATKARVRQLAEEMGYVPDALARGLRTRRTRLFGLIVPNLIHPVLGQAAVTIQDRAQELGFDLLVAQTQELLQREETALRRLLARRIDGLFIHPVYRLGPTSAIYDQLLKSGTPTVLLGHRAPFCAAFPAVETDDATASCRVTQHLIHLGHRRIAFFAGPPAAPWAQERFEGYRQALREAQIPFEDRLVFGAGSTIEDGEKAAGQMLTEMVEPTAVQTVSDLVAIGVLGALTRSRLRVPDDLSLAGFGNYVLGEHARVPLTTVQLPRQEIGLTAVQSMQRLLRGEKIDSKRLQAELIVRQSTAAPRPAATIAAPPPLSANGPLLDEDDL